MFFQTFFFFSSIVIPWTAFFCTLFLYNKLCLHHDFISDMMISCLLSQNMVERKIKIPVYRILYIWKNCQCSMTCTLFVCVTYKDLDVYMFATYFNIFLRIVVSVCKTLEWHSLSIEMVLYWNHYKIRHSVPLLLKLCFSRQNLCNHLQATTVCVCITNK